MTREDEMISMVQSRIQALKREVRDDWTDDVLAEIQCRVTNVLDLVCDELHELRNEYIAEEDLNPIVKAALEDPDSVVFITHDVKPKNCGCGSPATHEHDGELCCGGMMCCSNANE